MNMTICSASIIYSLETYTISCDDLDISDLEDEEYLNLLYQQQIELNELKQQHKEQLEEFSKTLFDKNKILPCLNKSSSFERLITL
jgi:hypothetical protein